MMVRAASLVSALALCLALLPASAAASHIQCGDAIIQDTTLDSDLVDCPGAGVVIGAAGITLDLNGHTIAATEESDGQSGVDNSGGHDGVTVKNGTITDFFAAVRFVEAGAGVVSGLEVVRGLVWVGGGSDRNRIEANRILGQILVDGQSSDNEIARNHVTRGAGVLLVFGFRNRIEDNVVTEGGAGIVALGANDTTIARNTVSRNIGAGISNRSNHTLIEGNHVTRNGFGSVFQDPNSGIVSFNSLDVTIRGNHVSRNGLDGISIVQSQRGVTIVEGNMTLRNGDDGIDVDQATLSPPQFHSATVARNKAHHNGDYGVEAVPGVTDGGGNKAHGNGNPQQCLNVSCN